MKIKGQHFISYTNRAIMENDNISVLGAKGAQTKSGVLCEVWYSCVRSKTKKNSEPITCTHTLFFHFQSTVQSMKTFMQATDDFSIM